MIKIENLVKQFAQRTVVNQLSLCIKQGETFGLLGPNGAGKTTTIRILTMLTKPTSGNINILGCDILKDDLEIKKIIGVVPQHYNLDIDLTARENLELHGRLHHLPAKIRRERIGQMLEYVDLTERSGDMVQTFSGGMKRRLMIARALLHQPKVLFLDEPTAGLDPQVRRKLWDLIRNLNTDGITVLLTTHYIEEAENLCRRVAIMDKGSLIALQTPKILCERVGNYVVEFIDKGTTEYRFFADRQQAAQFVGELSIDAVVRRSNLEDVFVELTGRKVTG